MGSCLVCLYAKLKNEYIYIYLDCIYVDISNIQYYIRVSYNYNK